MPFLKRVKDGEMWSDLNAYLLQRSMGGSRIRAEGISKAKFILRSEGVGACSGGGFPASR